MWKVGLLSAIVCLFATETAWALTIEIPSCGPKFYCPDHCNITWRDGCPHNCFCGPIKYCPAVTCPASFPICLVFTLYDGCQSCACKIPFAFLKANESVDEAQLLYDDPGHLRHMHEGQNLTDQEGNDVIIAKKMMCTIRSMNRIDTCLRNTMDYHKFARQRKRDDQPTTINPMVLLGDHDMKTLCRLFKNATTCIGDEAYEDCRRVHPDLSELDSLLSYACGPKSHYFFRHFPCISNVHKEDPRVQRCEDLFVNALLAINESPGPLEQKQVQKCLALNWFLRCGRPTVYKSCSQAAANVYVDSLMSATEYMAPECHPNFEEGTIVVKPAAKRNITLFQPKENPNCSMTHQFAVHALFNSLFQEIRALTDTATPAFPVAYAYNTSALYEKCEEFRSALYHLPVDVRLRCYRTFEVFDQVYGIFAYPCAPATQEVFFLHFGCLRSLRYQKSIADCEEDAARHLADPSIDQCETYDLMVRCVHKIVERRCGSDAWEVHFQLLTQSVRRYVPQCTLARVYRPPAP